MRAVWAEDNKTPNSLGCPHGKNSPRSTNCSPGRTNSGRSSGRKNNLQ